MSLEEPRPAVERLVAMLPTVSTEHVDLAEAGGRVLAEGIVADRPSPSADVTAMDGYAVATADTPGELPVSAEASIGRAPPALDRGTAVRVFTGAPIPPGADAVVKREDVVEKSASNVVDGPIDVGRHIRYEGENLAAGEEVVAGGVEIETTVAAALATFGVDRPKVFRRVGVGTIATGDEVLAPSDQPTPWQLRDSNTSAITVAAGSNRWVELVAAERRVDNKELLTKSLTAMLEQCDVVFLSGGVSMGNYDFVPEVISGIGGEIVFHRLRQRPGKPLLGALGPQGQAIIGLPGNPVSVMVTAHRWGSMVLRKLAGFSAVAPPVPSVLLADDDGATIDLWWHRLVTIDGDGLAHLVPSRGSGDLVSAARSSGFIVVPPQLGGQGPWPYYGWTAS